MEDLTRRTFVVLRLRREERATLRKAALISRQPLSTFVRELALDVSRTLLERPTPEVMAGRGVR